MKTSYFGRLRYIDKTDGLYPISIATRPPEGVQIASYPILAPSGCMLRWPRTRYEPQYRQKLSDLDAGTVWHQLHMYTGGREPVLLCYEKPPFTQSHFCHRRFVAEWFALHLGEFVEEWGFAPDPAYAVQGVLF